MVADRLQEIAERLNSGCSLESVERELIDCAASLDEDERAALWLFAWAYQPLVPTGAPLDAVVT